MSSISLHPPHWIISAAGSERVLCLGGDWIAQDTGVRSPADVAGIVEQVGSGVLRVDCDRVGRWDSALVAFLRLLHERARIAKEIQVDDAAVPPAARQLLALASTGTAAPRGEPRQSRKPVASLVGEAALGAHGEICRVTALVGETVLRGLAAVAGRTRTRWQDVLQLMREAGAGALLIAAICNGLVGAILAFVGAVQFRRFGAGIYVADLVGIAVVREMAAVMTAIVMAGRTGGAYAAHIATMQGNEEIDALKTFGIPPFDFLVLPRILALVTMMPLLYLYGCAIGLLGGYVVGVATLDLTSSAFLVELRNAVAGREFAIGLVKSIAFGGLVALAGCHLGLRAGRSAADVGRAATSAVVAGIIGIIALDAVFAACTNALGI
ncbi:MAG: ABC transporter permease [Alphaproteobacteria bacterium]|nr:ABC transporter permease [Alphaproteobacteria bacterium]MBV8413550.1 ABC transporter permease [Alphaproteobacteria bacterium]